MNTLPSHLIQYQLLPFLNIQCSKELTKASNSLFHALRHKIRRRGPVTTCRYVEQSCSQSKHIGVCSTVASQSRDDLNQLLQHIADTNSKKVCALLYLVIEFNEALDDVVLPSTIRTRHFDHNFNHPLADTKIPENLQTVVFGSDFDHYAGIILPVSLRCLIILNYFETKLVDIHLPPNLIIRKYGRSLSVDLLPPGVKIVRFQYFCYDWLNIAF